MRVALVISGALGVLIAGLAIGRGCGDDGSTAPVAEPPRPSPRRPAESPATTEPPARSAAAWAQLAAATAGQLAPSPPTGLPPDALARLGEPGLVHPGLAHLAFGPGDRFLISSGAGRVRLWDAATGGALGPPIVADELVISDDGTLAAAIWNDPSESPPLTLELRDLRAGTTIRVERYDSPPTPLQFVGATLLLGRGRPASWTRTRTDFGFRGLLLPIAYLDGGRMVAGWEEDSSGFIAVKGLRSVDFRDPDPRCYAKLQPRDEPVLALAPDRRTLAICPHSGSVHIVDLPVHDDRCQRRLLIGWRDPYPRHHHTALAFTADSRLLWIAAQDRPVRIFDARAGGQLVELDGGVAAPVVAITADRRRLATASAGGRIRIWNDAHHDERVEWQESQRYQGYLEPSGAKPAAVPEALAGPVRRLGGTGHGAAITEIRFTDDGKRVVTGGGTQIMSWDVATATQKSAVELGGKLFRFGRLAGNQLTVDLQVGTHLETRLVDLDSGRVTTPAERITDDSRAASGSRTRAVSPDGSRVAVGTPAGELLLQDAASGETIAAVRAAEVAITALAFSPDGTRLVSGSADTTALLWDVATLPRQLLE